ncbi:hypothetical protein ACFFGV_13800 [Pontibacillus salicampi]|uniref:Uncharacterized protein n=1 Tax=Pontibacillus salicampi TaxID=1449801 RepID=A0ABV6LQF5_9BACI
MIALINEVAVIAIVSSLSLNGEPSYGSTLFISSENDLAGIQNDVKRMGWITAAMAILAMA